MLLCAIWKRFHGYDSRLAGELTAVKENHGSLRPDVTWLPRNYQFVIPEQLAARPQMARKRERGIASADMNALRVPDVPLAGGDTIPQLGFGTYKVAPDRAEGVVSDALAAGYRHIDTAAMYGNERGVGRALATSGLPRADLFVTSKLDNPFHAPRDVPVAFARSLDDLGLDKLDLYLIHWPLASTTDIAATWAAVVDLLESGRVGAVGVSNFTDGHLQTIIEATGAIPAVNQIEVNPYLSQEPLRAVHRQLGILTQAWSPLARGRVLVDPAVVHLAARLGVSPSQAVLAWHLSRGDIVFPKTTDPVRMAENLASLAVELDAAAHSTMDCLNCDERSGSDPAAVELTGGRLLG